jgi:allantoin racemase
MRIAIIGSGTASTALPAHFAAEAAVLEPAAVPTLVNPRLSAFAFTPYERLVVDLGYVDAVQAAAAQDAHAIMINSFADYGIEAARAAVGVPVVGAGEAAIREASAGGTRRFAIVTVWPRSMGFLYDERLRSVPGGARCTGVRYVSREDELARLGADDGVMARMARHEAPMVAALLRECEAAVREDGAEAIALGCTCMAPVGPLLAGRCSVPVIESSRAGLRAAIGAAQSGARAETRATAAAPARARNARLVPAIVSAWQLGGPGVAGASEADCAVCLTEADLR